MKKSIVLFALISTTFFVKAQTSTGNMMVGGTLSVSSTNYGGNNDAKYSSFTLAPSFGYFLKDNFVIGASVSLSNSKDNNGLTETRRNGFGVGPFARFYKFSSNEQFAFFGNASVGFGGTRVEGTGADSRVNTISFSLSPGFAYFFSEHWAAELGFAGLRIQNSKDPNASGGTTTIDFNISSFTPNLGIRYHFGN